MYTLFAAPMTCSLAVHTVLRGLAVPHTLVWVPRGPGRLVVDQDLMAKNPKRKVPTLVLPDGEVLTEIAVVLDHLDEMHGPDRSPKQRRQHRQWLAFLSTELHKQVLAPAFDPETPAAANADARGRLLPHVLHICADAVESQGTLLGGPVSPADAYLWWALVLLGHQWPEDVPAVLHEARDRWSAAPDWRAALGQELTLWRTSSSQRIGNAHLDSASKGIIDVLPQVGPLQRINLSSS